MSTQAQREEWARKLSELYEELHWETKGNHNSFLDIPEAREMVMAAGDDFHGVDEHTVPLLEEIIRNWKGPDRLLNMFDGEDVANGEISNFYEKEGEALRVALNHEDDPFSTGWFFARYTGSGRSESAEVSRLNNGTVNVDVRICDGEGYDYVESLVWEAMGGDEFAENGSKALVELGILSHEVPAAISTIRDTLDPLVTLEDNCIEMGESLRWDIDFTGVRLSLDSLRGDIMAGLDDMRQKALRKVRQLLRQSHGKDWSPRFNTIWDKILGN